jgi:hypothetical protein
VRGINCDFDPEGHVYIHDCVAIPSTTNVLQETGISTDYSGIPDSVMRKARERGRYVDECLRALDSGELEESEVHPEAQGYIAAYKRFKAERGFVTYSWGSPRVVEINGMKMGMTEDVTGWMKKEPWLIDVKCTAEIPESARVQTALYARGLGPCLVNKEGIVSYELHRASATDVADPTLTKIVPWRRAALQLFPDSTYKFEPHADPLDEVEGLSALFLVTRRNNRRKKI